MNSVESLALSQVAPLVPERARLPIRYVRGLAWLCIIAIVIMTAFLTLGARTAQSTLQTSSNWQIHTLAVMLTSQQLLSAYQEAELGERGFLRGSDGSYSSRLGAARVAIPKFESALAALIQDNPAQIRNLQALKAIRRTSFEQFSGTFADERSDSEKAERALIRLGVGERTMDQVRAVLGRVAAEEARLLKIRDGEVSLAEQASDSFTTLLSLSSILLVFALGILAVNFVHTREGAAAQRVRDGAGRLLREKHDLLQAVINGSHDPIYAKDLNGMFVLTNQRAGDVFAARAEDMIGKRYGDFASIEATAALSTIDAEVIATGQAQAIERVVSDRGELRTFLSSKVPWRVDGAIIGVIGISRDITDRKRDETILLAANDELETRVLARTVDLERALATTLSEIAQRNDAEMQMRQMQKLESIGQLTGGIAHDFNNMLAIVIGSLGMARRRLNGSEDPKIRQCIDNADEGAARAAGLTARLLAFSRQQALAPEPVDPNKLVGGVSELLKRTLGEQIEVQTILAGGIWRIFADSDQLESAVINLAVNGRDAMADGGKLTIETSNADLDESYTRGEIEVEPGQYVLISVSDCGGGMPAEVIAKAFDPFYTTKPVGKGTGLGLSQVFGFIKQSGGHVKIYSELGHGTIVKIYLPRYTGSAAFATLRDTGKIPRGHSNQTILIVEDEAKVRIIADELLRELGYTVLQASDGNEALAQLALHPETMLLFTDIIMPEMNGQILASEAVRLHPGLKTLFTTGYSRNAVVNNGIVNAGVAVLAKPYTLGQLARKIRTVLDGDGGAQHDFAVSDGAEIDVRPVEVARDAAPQPSAPASMIEDVTDLPGARRILVVEDEALIALFMEEVVLDSGWSVVGPAASVAEALELIRTATFDAAILDMSLGSVMSFEVAAALDAHSIPFLFTTGYDGTMLPEQFAARTLLSKPISPEELTAALVAILDIKAVS